MMRARRNEKAFTVIELLVVIAIIMILAGILVPALVLIRANARVRLAKSTMKSICVALDRHYADRGFYPPDTGPHGLVGDLCQDGNTGNDDPYSLYNYLVGPTGAGVVVTLPSGKTKTYGPYMSFKQKELIDDGVGKIAIDPWGNPWVFEESLSYSLLRTASPDYNLTHHPTRYDIYSVGPDGLLDVQCHNAQDTSGDGFFDTGDDDGDGIFDENDEGVEGDDITNWD